jgi:[histone H3]-lysine9 N-trimethyltransferase EHMT
MNDLVKGLLSQMSSKFNEQTNSELVKNLDYQEDKTLKWKTLINNTYAKKDREKRNKNRIMAEDLADDKSSQQLPLSPSTSIGETPSLASAGAEAELKVDKSEVMEGSESSEGGLIIGEKFGNNVKEKKLVIDDDLHTTEQKTAAATSTHTGAPKESDDEKNISTNLPQLNTNSQAIESTKVTTTVTSSTDKKLDTASHDGVGVALSDDDKRASSAKPKPNSNSNASKTIDKTTSARNLRSNKNSSQASTTPTQRQTSASSMSDDKNKNDETTIKSDLDEADGTNEDSSATNDTAQSSTPKKFRGRPKVDVKSASEVKQKSSADGGEQMNESESDVSQKRGRRALRLRSIIDTAEEKKTESLASEELEVKRETETEETPKRRGRSRKLMEEKEDKDSEIQNDEDGSKAQDQIESPKRKRGRFIKKSSEPDLMEDNKSEVSKTTENSDDAKPRLLMTIRTDKSAVPKIINAAQPASPTVANTATAVSDEQEKIIKKRGRRPKTTPITKPIQVKKSQRLAKDGSETNISESVNIRKEKPEPPILAPPIGRIRSQRRIKPTAKILANEELRQGFEVTNCKRLSLSNENLMEHLERSPTMSRSGNDTSSTKSPIASSPEKSPKTYHHEPHQETESNVILHKLPPAKKLCRDPQDFINEIKSFKIATSRSPEENKKLTKSQQRRLIKAKEKHLGLLGLKPRVNHSDSSNESTTSEDFVPTKMNRGPSRPANTLRSRNQRAAEMHKRNMSIRKRELALAQKRLKLLDSQTLEIDMSDDDDCIVVENSKVVRSESSYNGNKENNNVNLICSCHQKTKYCINHNQSPSVAVNGKMFCCAIDEIESRKIGCTNELSESLINLFRPSVKVSFMALCSSHKKRLVSHNCCSGCGIFCTQGTFVICSNKHFFHRNCATKYILNTPYEPNNPNFTGPTLLLKCPHCGIDAPDFDYRVTMRCENLPVFVQHRSSTVP